MVKMKLQLFHILKYRSKFVVKGRTNVCTDSLLPLAPLDRTPQDSQNQNRPRFLPETKFNVSDDKANKNQRLHDYHKGKDCHDDDRKIRSVAMTTV